MSSPRDRHLRDGIVLHRVHPMAPADRTVRDRIPVTSLARTLLDVASIADERTAAAALEEADRLRLLVLADVDALIARRRGQPGTRRLATALAAHREPHLARSELEARFLRLCADAGLPAPSVNTSVAGLEVDALWPRQRLVVELDGYAHHRHRVAFERDRARDTTLRLAGYDVLRFTHRQIEDRPDGVLNAVETLLAQAARRPK